MSHTNTRPALNATHLERRSHSLTLESIASFPDAPGLPQAASRPVVYIYTRKASTDYSSLQITTWGIWIAAVLTLPFTLLELRGWQPAVLLTLPVILSVLYLGVISTAVAFFCWNKGLALLPSHQAGLFFFFQPVVGSLLGWLILGEVLTASFFLGSLLIVGGVYLTLSKGDPLRLTMEELRQE